MGRTVCPTDTGYLGDDIALRGEDHGDAFVFHFGQSYGEPDPEDPEYGAATRIPPNSTGTVTQMARCNAPSSTATTTRRSRASPTGSGVRRPATA